MSMQSLPSSFKRKHGEHCLIPAWKWTKNRLLMFEGMIQSKQDVLACVQATDSLSLRPIPMLPRMEHSKR
eukprot:scaffold187_cov101-Skeletonema_dohrnii-CCMP3373.AAC.4